MSQVAKKGRSKEPAAKSRKFIEAQERLLKIAYEEFSARDFDDVRLQEIAARAGMLKTGLFYYFPSKVHLLWHVFDRWLERRCKIHEKLLEITDPKACLIAMIRENLNMAARDRHLVRYWVYHRPDLDAPIAVKSLQKHHVLYDMLRSAIRDCMDAGVLPKCDEKVALEILFAPALSLYTWFSPEQIPTEKAILDILKVVGLDDAI